MPSGSCSGAGDMASADVATAKATLINNLIIVFPDKQPSAKRPVGDQQLTPGLTSRGQDGGPNPVAGYGHPNTPISGPAPPRIFKRQCWTYQPCPFEKVWLMRITGCWWSVFHLQRPDTRCKPTYGEYGCRA